MGGAQDRRIIKVSSQNLGTDTHPLLRLSAQRRYMAQRLVKRTPVTAMGFAWRRRCLHPGGTSLLQIRPAIIITSGRAVFVAFVLHGDEPKQLAKKVHLRTATNKDSAKVSEFS